MNWAENFRMANIKINAKTPNFTKPKIIFKTHSISEKEVKINQTVCHVKIYSLTFDKSVLISGVNGVISIELNVENDTIICLLISLYLHN